MKILATFFPTFARWFGAGASVSETGRQLDAPGRSVHDATTPTLTTDGALQVSTVWACVKLLAETVGSLPCFVYRNSAIGRELARDIHLYRLLHDKPNRRHTAVTFWTLMIMALTLRGNAYALIQRNQLGQVIGLWPLSPDQVEVIAQKDGSLIYAAKQDSEIMTFGEGEMLHIRGMGNNAVGFSTLDFMRASLGVAINAQNHTARTITKDGKRPGVLSIGQVLTKEQREAIRQNFADITKQSDRELYILEAGMKFEPLSMSPADMQLLETRRFSVEDICRWFGVPSVLVNDTSKTTTWGTGVEQIIEGFYKFTVRPILELTEQCITEKVLTPAERTALTIEFSLDALLRATLKDRMEIYAKGTQNGIYSRNECRQYENLPPIEGGDILTAQINLAPLHIIAEGKGDKVVLQNTIS